MQEWLSWRKGGRHKCRTLPATTDYPESELENFLIVIGIRDNTFEQFILNSKIMSIAIQSNTN